MMLEKTVIRLFYYCCLLAKGKHSQITWRPAELYVACVNNSCCRKLGVC